MREFACTVLAHTPHTHLPDPASMDRTTDFYVLARDGKEPKALYGESMDERTDFFISLLAPQIKSIGNTLLTCSVVVPSEDFSWWT